MNSCQDLLRELGTRLQALAQDVENHLADTPVPNRSGATPTLSPMLVDLPARARAIMAERKARRTFLPADLFHEPAWDMLLALYIADDADRAVNVKALVSYSDAPATTSQRWLDHLHKLGLILRVTDPIDRRRVEISLSERGREGMTAYLKAISPASA